MPPDMQTFEMHTPGSEDGAQIVVMDGSSADAMGSFPPEWEERSQEVHRFGSMVLHVIDPADLAVSMVARFNERDREGIRALAECGLIGPDTFARRLEEAIDHHVGDVTLDRTTSEMPRRSLPRPATARPGMPGRGSGSGTMPGSGRRAVPDACRLTNTSPFRIRPNRRTPAGSGKATSRPDPGRRRIPLQCGHE